MVSTTSPSTGISRGRLIALRVIAVLWALVAALASFGLPSLLLAWSTEGDELPLRTMYVVWGVLAGVLIPVLALSLLGRARVGTARALAALVVAGVLALVIGFNTLHLTYFAYIVGPAVVLLALHPEGRSLRETAPVDRVTLVLAAPMAILAAIWGGSLAIESRTTRILETPSGEFTMHGQYAQAAVLAFTLALLALLGSFKQPGRWVVVPLVAVCTAIWGIAGLLFPDDATSPGAIWGAIAIAAAAAYLAAAAISARR